MGKTSGGFSGNVYEGNPYKYKTCTLPTKPSREIMGGEYCKEKEIQMEIYLLCIFVNNNWGLYTKGQIQIIVTDNYYVSLLDTMKQKITENRYFPSR